MVEAFLRWVTGRCEFHDRPTATRTAELERATGINPDAVEQLWAKAAGDPFVLFDDPDLIDCGRASCRRRRDSAGHVGLAITWEWREIGGN